MKRLSSIILICFSLCNIINSQACEKGRYNYLFKTYVMICKDITDKFPNDTITASSISCQNCNIPNFTEDLVVKFSGDLFNVSYSHIKTISPNAFKSFGKDIHRFLFSNNELTYIAPGVFNNFKNLDELNFRNNSLKEIAQGVFEDVSLNTLDLSGNQISDISGIARKLKVIKLNLSYNKISEVPVNAFNETTFWTGNRWRNTYQELQLANNQIEIIYPGSFQLGTGSSMRNLNLQNNRLTTIPNNSFSGLNDLKYLMLDSNLIDTLDIGSFNNLSNLLTLSLENNKLQNIPVGALSKLQHLDTLNLASNQLTTLDSTLFSGLASLNRLNLAHNKLKQLTPSNIFPLGKLTSLDVSNNRLRELDLKTIFSHQTRLRTVTINDNFWSCPKLVQMYKIMNPKVGGFDRPAKHFDVPNLHGIACSRVELDYDDNMTFEEFMNIISQDSAIEDLYDSRINGEGDMTATSLINLSSKIAGIYWMFILITIMFTVIFLRFLFINIYGYLRTNAVIANKINFSYSRTQDENVQLM